MIPELVFNPHALGGDNLVHALTPHEDKELHQWYRKSLCGQDKGLIMTTAAVGCKACLEAIKSNGGGL